MQVNNTLNLLLCYHISSYGILSALMVPYLSLWNNICGNITVRIISYYIYSCGTM